MITQIQSISKAKIQTLSIKMNQISKILITYQINNLIAMSRMQIQAIILSRIQNLLKERNII